MTGPLTGLTVVELAGIGPGPFACMMLADMGAEVIRVDRKSVGQGSAFAAMASNDGVVDRGRRSIAVDLKHAAGIETVLRLIERSDVLIEGFRPGVVEKLGLGPEVCLARNPKLIYGRMTGWGQHGPLAQSAGHDLNYIALSGALHAMGAKDQPPFPPLNLVGDYGGGGMLMALGVMAALFETSRSGLGQVVDAAMSDGAAILMATLYGLKAKGHWQTARESNFLDGAAHFYGSYECADGKYIAIGPIEPQFYQLLLKLCDIDDVQFQQQWSVRQWPELKQKLAVLFKSRPRSAWCDLLEGTDACFSPVLDMDEAAGHPHNQARQTFVSVEGVMQPAPAPRFARTPSQLSTPAPGVGRDSVAVLRQYGHSEAEIAALVDSGAIFAADKVAVDQVAGSQP